MGPRYRRCKVPIPVGTPVRARLAGPLGRWRMNATTRRLISVVLAVIALAGGSLASAAALGLTDPPASLDFKAQLNGYQETPSVSTTGFGEFRAKLVDDTTLHYVFTYGG